ncbi:MAG: SDR family oxidoreductase [Clostridiales bacterium]|jgi:short-subunit dehydrogenase|nr:SDR family oxidoreductase [Clostridiales bacterium]
MKQISVVTGGSSGLGRAIASELIGKGINVCIVSRDAKKIKEAIAAFPKGQAEAIFYAGDVSDERFVIELFKNLNKDGYYVNYLYNVAGVGVFGKAKDMNLTKIQKAFQTNAIGLLLTTYESCRNMTDGGTIINIGSTASLKGNVEETLYCATKWAVRGFTEALKAEYKGKNIHFIGVYPGGMKTPFWTDDCGSNPDTSKWMEPSEVAEVVVNAVLEKKTLYVNDIVIERK